MDNDFTKGRIAAALFGLFESGIQTVADCYDDIINNVVASLLKVIPAAWDESACLEAEPDQYVTAGKRVITPFAETAARGIRTVSSSSNPTPALDATDVRLAEEKPADVTATYNLAGQKVDDAQRGVVIRGKRKIVR